MIKTSSSSEPTGFLDGQILLAMPGMTDSRFARSVIYVCAHSADGAMGIIVNQPAQKMTFSEILVQLDVMEEADVAKLSSAVGHVPVLKGGPVETGRGFVLHSSDYHAEQSTLAIADDVSLTATLDILRAIAKGEGPRRAMLALGYAGWGSGQLESEIQANGWLHCPADDALLFDRLCEGKYDRAMAMIGIDPRMLSAEAGHA